MSDEKLTQLLRAAAAGDNRSWSEGPSPPKFPPGCPTVSRMYRAILREDFTSVEIDALKSYQYATDLLEKVRRNVWYPTVLQLFKHTRGRLSGDEKDDVEYHLQVDKCKRSLRLVQWMSLDSTFKRVVESSLQSAGEAISDRLGRFIDSVSASQQVLQPIPLPAGAATADVEQLDQTVLFDNGQLTATLSRVKDDHWLDFESQKIVPATLLRVTLLDGDGKPTEELFVMLREGFSLDPDAQTNSAAKVRITQSVPEDCLLLCQTVEADELGGTDADGLRSDFEKAGHDDTAAVDHWRTWATKSIRDTELAVGVRPALEDIIGS